MRSVKMATDKQFFVYILASRKNGALYIGGTSDIIKRVYEHQNDLAPGFTEKYQIHEWVFYEIFENIQEAIKREKQLKKWGRR